MVCACDCDGYEVETLAVCACAGDLAAASLGECPLADGEATEGWSYVDELSASGELSFAVKELGDRAIGGVANVEGCSAACIIVAGVELASVCTTCSAEDV